MTVDRRDPAVRASARPINWATLPEWAYRTAVADRATRRGASRPPSVRRVVHSVRPGLRQPVFVIGAPRSGTTFLGECLATLPGLSYHHEPVASKAAARYVYERRWGERRLAMFYRAVYRGLLRLRLNGDLRLAEKTPRNCLIVPFLSRTFPDARFIHILRDGRDVALSLSRRSWLRAASAGSARRGAGGTRDGPSARFWVEPDRRREFAQTTDIHRSVWAWRRHVESALRAAAALSPTRYHELRYEALVAHPHREAERLLDFLDVEGRDRRWFHDAVAAVRSDSVGRWRREIDDDGLAQIMAEAGSLLQRLGYADAG